MPQGWWFTLVVAVYNALDFLSRLHLVAHARKGQDESKAPRKMDVKGSGNIVNQADNVFSVWRNKPKEEADCPPETDPDAILYVDKQRNGEGP